MVHDSCGHQAGIPGLSMPIQQAERIKEALKRQGTRERRTWSWAVPGVFHGEEERACLSHFLSTSPWYCWGWGGPWKATERRWSESSLRIVSPIAQWGEAQTGKPNISCYGNTEGASPSKAPICVSLEDK